jgi:hypothetical protein
MNFFQFKKYFLGKPFVLVIGLVSLILVKFPPQITFAQIVEETLKRDDLVIDQTLPWGVKQWPYGKVIEVLDLGDTVYGKVVIDRYGKDESGGFISQPFSRTKPGKFVFVSLWGSNLDGCYVETVVQIAPKNEIEAESTLPTLLEFGMDGQIFRLPYKETSPKIITYKYNFLDNNNIQKQALWHMNHRIFPVDSVQASKLINAPIQDIEARMHFGENKSIPFIIGADTVERWQDIYTFNSSCKYVQ